MPGRSSWRKRPCSWVTPSDAAGRESWAWEDRHGESNERRTRPQQRGSGEWWWRRWWLKDIRLHGSQLGLLGIQRSSLLSQLLLLSLQLPLQLQLLLLLLMSQLLPVFLRPLQLLELDGELHLSGLELALDSHHLLPTRHLNGLPLHLGLLGCFLSLLLLPHGPLLLLFLPHLPGQLGRLDSLQLPLEGSGFLLVGLEEVQHQHLLSLLQLLFLPLFLESELVDASSLPELGLLSKPGFFPFDVFSEPDLTKVSAFSGPRVFAGFHCPGLFPASLLHQSGLFSLPPQSCFCILSHLSLFPQSGLLLLPGLFPQSLLPQSCLFSQPGCFSLPCLLPEPCFCLLPLSSFLFPLSCLFPLLSFLS